MYTSDAAPQTEKRGRASATFDTQAQPTYKCVRACVPVRARACVQACVRAHGPGGTDRQPGE